MPGTDPISTKIRSIRESSANKSIADGAFWQLSDAQRVAVEYLNESFNTAKPVTQRCKELDITRTTYYQWVNDPTFQLARVEIAKSRHMDSIPQYFQYLDKYAAGGNARAIQIGLEIGNAYKPGAHLQDSEKNKVSAHTPDDMLVQATRLRNQLDDLISTLQMRVRAQSADPHPPAGVGEN